MSFEVLLTFMYVYMYTVCCSEYILVQLPCAQIKTAYMYIAQRIDLCDVLCLLLCKFMQCKFICTSVCTCSIVGSTNTPTFTWSSIPEYRARKYSYQSVVSTTVFRQLSSSKAMLRCSKRTANSLLVTFGKYTAAQ